jgi:hypothetical protein
MFQPWTNSSRKEPTVKQVFIGKNGLEQRTTIPNYLQLEK